MTSEALEVRDSDAMSVVRVTPEIPVDALVARKERIVDAMQRVMTDGIHYGKVPGVSKPTLLKPGAEVLCVMFELAAIPESEERYDGDHLTVKTRVTLYDVRSGNRVAAGEGICSSREKKYAKRKAERVCPACGAEAIIKGKAEYGGGWTCWKKRGGCGARFPDGDAAIENQDAGEKENPDLPDTWNTILKMAEKRALVGAVLHGTGASDVFTQDVEDLGSGPAAAAAAEAAENPGEGQVGRESRPVPEASPERDAAVQLVAERFGYLASSGPKPPEGFKDWNAYMLTWCRGNVGTDDVDLMTTEELEKVAKHLDEMVLPI